MDHCDGLNALGTYNNANYNWGLCALPSDWTPPVLPAFGNINNNNNNNNNNNEEEDKKQRKCCLVDGIVDAASALPNLEVRTSLAMRC